MALLTSNPRNGYGSKYTKNADYGQEYSGSCTNGGSYKNGANGSYGGYGGAPAGGTGDYLGRSGWSSYSGKFWDSAGCEVKVSVEGEVRKGTKVTLTYYVPQGEAIGYIIENGREGWTVQGTYSDEASTGKFWLTFDPRSGSIRGTRTPHSEMACIGGGFGLTSQPWIMSPACRRDRSCTGSGCSVM